MKRNENTAFYDMTEKTYELRIQELELEIAQLKTGLDTRLQVIQDMVEAVNMRGGK